MRCRKSPSRTIDSLLLPAILTIYRPVGKKLLRPLPAHRQSNGEEAVRGIRIGFRSYSFSPTRSLYNIGNPIQRIGLPYFVKSYYGKRSISPDGFVRPRAEPNAIRAAPKQTDDGQPEVRHGESGGFALEPAKTGGGSRLPSISIKDARDVPPLSNRLRLRYSRSAMFK